MGGRMRLSPCRRITLSYIYTSVFCIRLVFTPAPFCPGRPQPRPTLPRTAHPPTLHCPLPPVFTVESHIVQIGTEQPSEAEETWSHCSGNWTGSGCSVSPPPCPFLSAYPRMFITSAPLPPPPTLPTHTQLLNIRPLWVAHATQCVQHKSATRPLGGVIERRGEQLRGERGEESRAVWIRQRSVAF